MEKHTVYLMPVQNYDEELVYKNLNWALREMGGISAVLSDLPKDSKIMLKPNLLRSADVDRAIITHPVVMGAVARIMQEAGYTDVTAGDSSGIGTAVRAMETSGMKAQLAKYGVKATDFDKGTKVDLGNNSHTQMVLCDAIVEADAVINVCKMKTHELERITGAVKNMYGAVLGLHKAEGHTRFPNPHSFAGVVVDINKYIQPKLHIMDGIVAMDGNGPASGDPIPMNVLLVSKDPVALDTVFARLVHLEPELVPTINIGHIEGLGTMKDICIMTPEGEITMDQAVALYGNPAYRVDRAKEHKVTGVLSLFRGFKLFQKKPYIIKDACVRCGICVEACPVEGKAVNFTHGKKAVPEYDYKKCIRCFCCQEMCPNKAIKVKR